MLQSRWHRGALVRASAFLCSSVLGMPVADAQPFSLASTEIEFLPGVELDPQPEDSPDLEIGFTVLRAEAALPIPVGESTLLAGVRYSLTSVSTENDPLGETPDDFQELGLTLVWVEPVSESWTLMFDFRPELATDFNDVDGEHFRFSGAILANREVSESLRYGFGLAANFAFGELLPLPVLTLDWMAAANLRVLAALPGNARVIYLLGDRVELGLAAFLQGNQYTVSNDRAPELDNISYSVIHAGVTGSVRLFSNVWLNLYGGHTVFRRFELFDDSNTELDSTDLSGAPIVRAGVQLRIPPS